MGSDLLLGYANAMSTVGGWVFGNSPLTLPITSLIDYGRDKTADSVIVSKGVEPLNRLTDAEYAALSDDNYGQSIQKTDLLTSAKMDTIKTVQEVQAGASSLINTVASAPAAIGQKLDTMTKYAIGAAVVVALILIIKD